MQSRRQPGYIRFFYLFILLGVGAIVTDAVSDALTPGKPVVVTRSSTPSSTIGTVPDLESYIPPQWRAEEAAGRRSPSSLLLKAPPGKKNPFAACEATKAPQTPSNDTTAFAFLSGVRDDLAASSSEQLRMMEEMRDCARSFGSCRNGKVKNETRKLKQQIEKNILRLRVYMALMNSRASAYRARVWSENDASGLPTFTIKSTAEAGKDGSPFKNAVLKHLVGSFADNGTIEPMLPEELKAAIDVFNKDSNAVMKSFKHITSKTQDERGARVAFFEKHIDETRKYYQSKYAVLIGRYPTLAYYGKGTYSDAELADSLETIRRNALAFHQKTIPKDSRDWRELRHLVMSTSAVEARLSKNPENCEIAHQLQLSLQREEDFKAFFNKWRGWGVFAGVTACWVFSGGSLGLACSAGGAVISSAFLAGDYVILDNEAAQLILDTKGADPKRILEIWGRTKKFKVTIVIHVIGVATLAGFIPISTTDPLRNAIQEILKTSTEPIATQILIERLAVKLQGVVEAKIIESLVNSWTEVEKSLAADKEDVQYYHQFVKKLRKS